MALTFNDDQKEKINIILDKFKGASDQVASNPSQVKKIVEDAYLKISMFKAGQLAEVLEEINLFLGIIKDYFNGSYKEIPYSSILSIIGALIYLISPMDFLPDFIPILGFVDDAYVIKLTIDALRSDMKKYQEWKSFTDH